MISMKAAFIFVAPGADHTTHKAQIDTPGVNLTVIGVKDYHTAEKVAKELVDNGTEAIELCAGFGIEGTAAVKRAVGGKAAIGVVRFDFHPGLDFKTGDELFL
jgi:hypothetical protein